MQMYQKYQDSKFLKESTKGGMSDSAMLVVLLVDD
jgi:hypothetical protein